MFIQNQQCLFFPEAGLWVLILYYLLCLMIVSLLDSAPIHFLLMLGYSITAPMIPLNIIMAMLIFRVLGLKTEAPEIFEQYKQLYYQIIEQKELNHIDYDDKAFKENILMLFFLCMNLDIRQNMMISL
ncbi:TPA: hypothetical protein ACT96X_002437 [Legionella pneumophila]|uniref:hypothetical protein n=2 Tax=Legionella pneumophila TaxID=446 RepID=UPI0012B685B8|nr:hypothetical protein [Legionella pneumophila]HEN5654938.1 hypothetical protein [Legionella pneumophila]